MQVLDARKTELTGGSKPSSPELLDSRPADLLLSAIKGIVDSNADPPGAMGGYGSMTSANKAALKGGKRKWSEDDSSKKGGAETSWKNKFLE